MNKWLIVSLAILITVMSVGVGCDSDGPSKADAEAVMSRYCNEMYSGCYAVEVTQIGEPSTDGIGRKVWPVRATLRTSRGIKNKYARIYKNEFGEWDWALVTDE